MHTDQNIHEIVLSDGQTRIEVEAYKDASFPSTVISIPDGIVEIGKDAFRGSNIEYILFPDSLQKIEEGAFRGSNIKRIVVPDSVQEIGKGAFQFCKSLEEVRLPWSLKSIEKGMFTGCHQLKIINLDELRCLQKIGSYAFDSCKSLEAARIPSSVEVLERGVFEDCNALEVVKLPKGITEIADRLFFRCRNLSSVFSTDNIKRIGVSSFQDAGLKQLPSMESIEYISDFAFASSKLTHFNFLPSLKYIGREAFMRSNLKEIAILGRVEIIGYAAFAYCDEVTKVSLAEGVREIQAKAFHFQNCDSISLPASLDRFDSLLSFGSPFYSNQEGNINFSVSPRHFYKNRMFLSYLYPSYGYRPLSMGQLHLRSLNFESKIEYSPEKSSRASKGIYLMLKLLNNRLSKIYQEAQMNKKAIVPLTEDILIELVSKFSESFLAPQTLSLEEIDSDPSKVESIGSAPEIVAYERRVAWAEGLYSWFTSSDEDKQKAKQREQFVSALGDIVRCPVMLGHSHTCSLLLESGQTVSEEAYKLLIQANNQPPVFHEYLQFSCPISRQVCNASETRENIQINNVLEWLNQENSSVDSLYHMLASELEALRNTSQGEESPLSQNIMLKQVCEYLNAFEDDYISYHAHSLQQ
ncbi:MAG: leucine-rich repeat domain-containing protein [Pseudomonadota bacterium]|nr:leucine-rich repeat domain-containing protein [Pseudomonadota bacterium]